MTGSFKDCWRLTWQEFWSKLTKFPQAPVDLFVQLFDDVIDFLQNPPTGTEYELIHNDPAKAKQAFHRLKGGDFKGEAAIIGFLEAAHTTIVDFGIAHFADYYSKVIKQFIIRYNLRYRVADPFKLRLLLSGTFAGLYDALETLNAANQHLAELMDDFEHAFDTYVRSQRQVDLKACIGKASMYAEGIAALAVNSEGSLGELCDRLACWPHKAVKESIKKLYGFCSNYPGIRHAGSPAGRLRKLESRDALFFSVLLFSFSGYITESINTKELLGF